MTLSTAPDNALATPRMTPGRAQDPTADPASVWQLGSTLETRYSHSHLPVTGFCVVPHSWSYSRIHIPRRCFRLAEPTSRDRALPGKNDGRVSIWLLSWGNADHLGGNNPNIGSTLKGSGWLLKKRGGYCPYRKFQVC